MDSGGDRAEPLLNVVKLHLGYVRENDCAEGVVVPLKFPMEFLDEGIQLRQQRIRGVAAIFIMVFQIGYGFLKGGVVPTAGGVRDRGLLHSTRVLKTMSLFLFAKLILPYPLVRQLGYFLQLIRHSFLLITKIEPE